MKGSHRQNQIVKLRKKKLKSGETSLYLDIYYKGKRSYEFLNMRLVPVKTALDRSRNKEMEALANNILAKRQLAIASGEHGFVPEFKKNMLFIKYFETQMEKRSDGKSNYQNWQSTLIYLKKYDTDTVMSGLDEHWLEGFFNYLRKKATSKNGKKISKNTAISYYFKVVACLKQAFKEKLTSFNPAQSDIKVKPDEVKREYLLEEELQKLAQTPCQDEQLKNAFLFSCFTGLRWSDVNALTWRAIEGNIISFKQKKTGALESLPVTEQALTFLGKRKADDEKIFNMVYSAWNNTKLREWALAAGIKKRISFHTARHTMATLSIANGVDLFVVSSLLGHKNLKTTQIYAKVIDAKKVEAVNKLPKLKLD